MEALDLTRAATNRRQKASSAASIAAVVWPASVCGSTRVCEAGRFCRTRRSGTAPAPTRSSPHSDVLFRRRRHVYSGLSTAIVPGSNRSGLKVMLDGPPLAAL
eukprot:15437650-Alexandrium_andersonii.AAC.1